MGETQTPDDLLEPDDDDDAEFDDVSDDLEVAGLLLAAAARDNHEAVAELRALPDTNWWNVSWTLALLLSKVRAGDQQSVDLVDLYVGAPPSPPSE